MEMKCEVLVIGATHAQGVYEERNYKNTKIFALEKYPATQDRTKGYKVSEYKSKDYNLFDRLVKVPAVYEVTLNVSDLGVTLLDAVFIKEKNPLV